MVRHILIIAASGAAALTAGCTTAPSYYSPVEVTRFVDPSVEEVMRGPIGVRPAPGQDPTDPAYAVYQTVLKEELDRIGFQVAGDVAPYFAVIDVERWVVEPGGQRSPVSVGGGASVGSYGSGVGLGIGLDLSGQEPDAIETQLAVSIRPSSGGDAIWEGRAEFTASANSEYADLTAAAQRVVPALFQNFPGNSGETIEVE